MATSKSKARLGKGTTFRLGATGGAREPRPSEVAFGAAVGRRARLLVVDDEAALARALQRGLFEHHDVVILTSGAEAVDHIAKGNRFDAILLDVMMPEMSGMDVYEEVLRLAPDQAKRTIFVTGGAFTASARAFLDRVPNPRIDKPIEMANLLAIIGGLSRE